VKNKDGSVLLKKIFCISFIAMTFNANAMAKEEEAVDKSYFIKTDYFTVRDGLYENSKGELLLETNGCIGSCGKMFIRRFGYAIAELQPLLGDVIDKDSWERISYNLYRDKDNTYCTFFYSSGLIPVVMTNLNPDKIRFWHENQWKPYKAVHKEYVEFAREHNVTIDVKTQYYNGFFSDGENVYTDCSGASLPVDFKTFQVDSLNSNWAVDKNNIYHGNRVVSIKNLDKAIESAGRFSSRKQKSLIELKNKYLKKKRLILHQ
jgi:hypothetical protein